LAELRKRVSEGDAIIAGTWASSSWVQPPLVDTHAYTVLSVTSDGHVTLRNPWGEVLHNGVRDLGLVTVTWDDFKSSFQEFDWG
jgi:hypothetical protein